MKKLKELLYNYINTPLDPYANIELGLEYEKLGHGAAALSFFLRTAELIHEENPEVAYCCIIKNWKQLNNTTRRPNEEKSQLETAVAFLPKRPEAYYHLSTSYSEEKSWKTAYMYSCLGLEFTNNSILPLSGIIIWQHNKGVCLISSPLKLRSHAIESKELNK